jgi:hypothetical protein
MNRGQADALAWVLVASIDIACTNWDCQTPDTFDDLILLCDLCETLGGNRKQMADLKDDCIEYKTKLGGMT